MGVKSWKSVLKEFPPAVAASFRFLVDDYGFAGPSPVNQSPLSISFMTEGFGYEIYLESREMKVATSAWTAYEDRYLSADLVSLVVVAGLATSHNVSQSASSVTTLKKSLASQAGWVRQIHSLLVDSPGGTELMRLGKVHGGGAV